MSTSNSANTPHLPRVFYGWWIVLAGTLGITINMGLVFQGFGTFFLPISHTFGGGRTAISGIFSFSRLGAGLLGPISGYLVDRFGPRPIMLIGIPLMGTGFILLSRVTSLVEFYFVFILLITVGSVLGFMTPISAAVANWFNRRRSLAFGVVLSGVGLGGLMLPLIGWMIDIYEWRTTAAILGVTIWIVGIPVALVIRHRPEPYGYWPDGIAPSDQPLMHASSEPPISTPSDGLTPRQALATSAFWFISLSTGTRMIITAGLAVHMIPYMVGMGISPTTAAATWGMTAVLSIPGRFGVGFLGDYFDKRYIMAGSLSLMAVALVGINMANTLAYIIPALVVFALSFGGLATLPFALRAEYFGRRHFGTIHGFSSTVQTVGVAAGPIAAGLAFDMTGSYAPAFWAFTGLALVSILLILRALPPKQNEAGLTARDVNP